MGWFSKKKAAEVKPARPTPKPSSVKKLKMLQGLLESFAIGTRIGYYPDFEKKLQLEGLIIGVSIDDEYIFRQSAFSFSEAPTAQPSNEFSGPIDLKYARRICFLVPTDQQAVLRLDHDKRAKLGKGSLFRKGNPLTLVSFNTHSQNRQLQTLVFKRELLKSGLHAGHEVALLEIALETVETFDPRGQVRVETSVPATISRNGTDEVMPATILDISEAFLRIQLEPSETPWPVFSSRDYAVISLKPSANTPMIQLKCSLSLERGNSRIFEISAVIRNGVEHPYSTVDGMQLKIILNQ